MTEETGKQHALQRPDLRPHEQGNTGIPFIHRFVGAEAGPNAMITALVHGNELCGAIALDHMLRSGLRPMRGTLTLAFMNIAASAADPPQRFLDEDMNRVWDPAVLAGGRDSRELARARQVQPALEGMDFLLDLHSMQDQFTPLALAGTADKGAALARGIGVPDSIVHDAGHPAGPRLRDYGRWADPSAPQAAVLIECGQHADAAAADLALESALRFLVFLQMLSPAAAAALAGRALPAPAKPQRRIRVTGLVTAAADFRLLQPWTGMEVIARRGTALAWNDGAEVVAPHDDCVLVMPMSAAPAGTTALRFGRAIPEV